MEDRGVRIAEYEEKIDNDYILHRMNLSFLGMYGNDVKFLARPKISFNLYGSNDRMEIDSYNTIYSDVINEWETKAISFGIELGVFIGGWGFYVGYTQPMVVDSFSKDYNSFLLGFFWMSK